MKSTKCVTFVEFLIVAVLWSSFFGAGCFIWYLICTAQPTVYIDEIFHAGQCLKYCQGNFHDYDPKLTTPPGLYIVTVAVLYPLSVLFQTDLCTLNTFRLFNHFVSQLNLILLYKIINLQVREFSVLKKLLLSLNLNLFPVLYFFNFVYYTDVVSTFLIFLTYYLYQKNRSTSAGLVGVLSVTIRQTNIVWFCCFAFLKCCEAVDDEASKAGRKLSKVQKRRISYAWVIVKESFHSLQSSFFNFVALILRESFFFIISAVSFAYYLLVNGSIVLGDKSAHQSVVHVPQLFYFSIFTYIFAFPYHISPSLTFFKNFKRQKLKLLLLTLVIFLIVHFNTMAHLYLISDNRHYTFYVWKRIFEKRFGRYLIIPAYIVSMYSIKENMRNLDGCTKFAFLACTVICLIPQKLLEFRYFIIPYFIYRFKTCQKSTYWQLLLEFLFNLGVNYLTISLFLNRPYSWPDGSIQRFSW